MKLTMKNSSFYTGIIKKGRFATFKYHRKFKLRHAVYRHAAYRHAVYCHSAYRHAVYCHAVYR